MITDSAFATVTDVEDERPGCFILPGLFSLLEFVSVPVLFPVPFSTPANHHLLFIISKYDPCSNYYTDKYRSSSELFEID
jgi:hypothetical protein